MTRKYMDEEIRHMINQVEQQEECNNQNIYQGVIIHNVYYEFGEMAFFDDRLKIYIPTTFFDMPMEFAKIKYPSGDRPQIIKTDDTGSVNITLNVITNTISDEYIPVVKDGIKNILTRLNPSYLFFEEGVEIIEGKNFAFFEFKSPTLDDPLFNFMFFVEIEHNVMMGCFSCPYEIHQAWRPVAHQIMQSVRVSTKPAEEAVEKPLAAGGRR